MASVFSVLLECQETSKSWMAPNLTVSVFLWKPTTKRHEGEKPFSPVVVANPSTVMSVPEGDEFERPLTN